MQLESPSRGRYHRRGRRRGGAAIRPQSTQSLQDTAIREEKLSSSGRPLQSLGITARPSTGDERPTGIITSVVAAKVAEGPDWPRQGTSGNKEASSSLESALPEVQPACPMPSTPAEYMEVIVTQMEGQGVTLDAECSMAERACNLQEQEDEVEALRAIYAEDFEELERPESSAARAFMISVNVDFAAPLKVLASLSDETAGSSPATSRPLSVLDGLTGTGASDGTPETASTSTEEELDSSLKSYRAGGQASISGHLHSASPCPSAEFAVDFLPPLQLLRAVPEMLGVEETVPLLMRWNQKKKDEAFQKEIHCCQICFVEQPGSDFAQLPCGHSFCCLCMRTMAEGQVADGAVTKINCPDTTCRRAVPVGVLRNLLPAAAFARWEALTLQRSLDSMKDLVYCPRCNAACLEDMEGDNHAQCGACFYSFCGLCRSSWHAGQPCMDAEARLRILQERGKGREAGEDQARREADLLNEVRSLQVIRKEAKSCPKCGMAISKIEGCNKMTCSQCQSYFCYRCGKDIDGYDHFRGGCLRVV